MSLLPDRMKTVKIVAPQDYSRDLLRFLALREDIDIIDMQNKPFTVSSFKHGPKINDLLNQFSRIIDRWDIKKKVSFPKKSAFIIIDDQKIDDILARAEEIANDQLKQLHQIYERRTLAEKELEKNKAIIEIAKHLVPLGLSFEDLTEERPYFTIEVGKMETKRIPRFKWNLDAITGGSFILKEAPLEGRYSFVAIGFLEQYLADVNPLLVAYGFEQYAIPERLTGKPEEVIEESTKKIEALNKKIEGLNNDAEKIIQESGLSILAFHEQLEIELSYLKIYNQLRTPGQKIACWGWVPEKQTTKFEKELQKFIDGKADVEFTTPVFDEDEYPSKTSVPPAARVYNGLVNAYGTPGYNEFNPALVVMITYPIIFGIMFGDFGHGLIFTLLGVYGLTLRNKQIDPTEGFGNEIKNYFKNGSILIIVSGVVSMIWGVLFGSYFGITHHVAHWVPKALWFSPESHEAVAYNPGTTPVILMLELSLVVGMIHMTVGYIFRFITNIKEGHIVEAFLVTGTLLVFHWSLFILVFTFGTNFMNWFDWNNSGTFDIAIISVKGEPVQFFQVRHALLLFLGGFALPLLLMTGYLATHGLDGIAELLELVLSTFSNTISYARIFAMNAVHGALSQIFLFTMFTDGFGVINILSAIILGSLVIVPLEGLFSFLQTLRLHWVEFFAKMHYQGTGTEFKPITVERRYSSAIPY
ncbi:MAG: hypothetical protein GF308_07970 [Candidatus Heimdallarchaeota archaeon]|nr:hypothetical protein [Candidatus Heimdallarchaeota archaeon]